jgi:hypothetical protein
MDLTIMERVGDRCGKMEGYCSTGQSPPWAVVPVEEEEEQGLQSIQHNQATQCLAMRLLLLSKSLSCAFDIV